MKTVKPIETRYKGHRFRSRLEARWAVFFDELHIRYEYELEGFALPSGAAYLPDFFLPDLGVFVEVKPTEKLPYQDLKRLVEFALAGDHRLVLIVGSPTQESMYLVNKTTASPLEEYEAEYEENMDKEQIVESFLEGLRQWGNVCLGPTPLSSDWQLLFRTLPPWDDHTMQHALLKAKQARFEFGEQG